MKLKPPAIYECQEVREWRNQAMSSLRTSFPLTEEMQDDFFIETVCNRNAPHRYFSIVDGRLVAFGGITNIEWENGIGEISLIVNPELHRNGIGSDAVKLLLDYAFNTLNLNTVYGECYLCSDAHLFWRSITHQYNAFIALLPARKYWDGQYFDSLYFSVGKDGYNQIHTAIHET